jgi:hypothetical protein
MEKNFIALIVKIFVSAIVTVGIIQLLIMMSRDGFWPKIKRLLGTTNNTSTQRRDKAIIVADTDAPKCPECEETMVMRTGRKSRKQFWGCPSFPKCRGTREVA